MDEPPGYGQYCPISRAVEVLGERWMFLIVRDLLCGVTRFNELARGNPGLSRSLLAKRLRQLERASIVAHEGGQYRLTDAGEQLRPIVFSLGEWGARWQFGAPREEELQPDLLLWWVHQRLDFSTLPARRVVLAFRFADHRSRYWIVRDLQGASLCSSDPGFPTDVTVESDLTTLYQVWLGRIDLRRALRNGEIRVSGDPVVLRQLPVLFTLSPVAPAVAATLGAPG